MELGIGFIQDIGASLGLPLAIALCIIAMTLKGHAKRLDEGDKRMTKIEEKHEDTEALLQEIRANVAYIKGKLERE